MKYFYPPHMQLWILLEYGYTRVKNTLEMVNIFYAVMNSMSCYKLNTALLLRMNPLLCTVSTALSLVMPIAAWSQGADNVSPSNGTHSQQVVDLSLQASAGEVTAALILMQARSPCNSFTGDTMVFDTIPANSTAHGTTILGNDPLSAFTGTLVK
jgi:hypothetical protein